MPEYISREEAINAIKSLKSSMPAKDNYAKGYDAALWRALIAVREVPPAADVQPVKRGKWEKKRGYLVCSNCGMTVDTIGYTYEEQEEVFRYCSCCGYRMDGDAE